MIVVPGQWLLLTEREKKESVILQKIYRSMSLTT